MILHRSVEVAGRSIHVADHGSGRPILLVHGFPLDHTMWRHQLDELAGDFRLIAPDLFGFGQNKPATEAISMAQAADELAGVLDQLRVDQPIVFCGLSMGGYIGWEFWNHHRHRISHLIMCDTRAAADSQVVARGREMMADSIELGQTADVADTMIPKLFSASSIESQPTVVLETRQVIQRTAPGTIAAYQRGMACRSDFSERLAKIEQPMLFLCGAADQITPPAEMKAIADQVSNAIYVEVASAGHLAPLEQPQAVNRAIRSWLA